MDITFHYFAVKTVALAAGFSDSDAQTIAQYSQYVDDYNPTFPRRYSNVPDWIVRKPGSDIYISSRLNPFNFSPVTTGFQIPIDAGELITEKFQRYTVSPFHFIPYTRNAAKRKSAVSYPAKITGGCTDSLISDAIQKAKSEYKDSHDETSRRQALMHIGMLLHTFSDTYAHQLFSGYNNNCNNLKVAKVIDNRSGRDITFSCKTYVDRIIDIYAQNTKKYDPMLFMIGHMLVGHIPDWAHITFDITFFDKNGGIERIYHRNNTDCFTDVAIEIYKFLNECRENIASADTEERLKNDIHAALLSSDISGVENNISECMSCLKGKWGLVFPDYLYHYNSAEIFDGIVGSGNSKAETANDLFPSMSDDFYKYNSYAEDLLISIYGDNPKTKKYKYEE